jgi:UDP-N-acetyl-D-mannosaminuronic acid dehydrogenase
VRSVVTIGLGYIGLPTSALIASNGVPVFGVDVNQRVVDTINRGEIHIVEPELDEIVKKAVNDGLLKAGTKALESEVYLIVVPTPFKGDHEPDISYVEAATEQIIPLLKENDLYIIESTSPIGTTEKMRNGLIILLGALGI